ncbi:MAG: hypothetical protein M1813_002630 [Trichoglossum hirsutum]|nr:MAG: hypothetical protein M1813_002630 [Trichoglossum hirsutum]
MDTRIFVVRTSGFSSGRRRHIIPSPEKASLFRMTEISSKKSTSSVSSGAGSPNTPRRKLFPKSVQVHLDNEFELPEINKYTKKTPAELIEAITVSNHIVFDFTLFEHGLPRMPKSDELSILSNLFPTQFALTVVPPMLTIHVRTLPQKPWPLTVAGLPLYLTTDEWNTGYDHGRQGVGPKVLTHLNAKLRVTKGIFEAAVKFFETEAKVDVDYIQWTTGLWKISVADGTSLANVPSQLAGILCRYVFASKEVRPREAALRLLQPTSTVRDDTQYNDLRPGVMVSSGVFSDPSHVVLPRPELYTTSGVLVKNNEGEIFITVASHGFPLGEETAYHPTPSGRVIGKVERRLGETDIALVRPDPGLTYTNEIFANPGTTTGKVVTGIRNWEDIQLFSTVYMENPFTGYAEGQFLGVRYQRLPADEPAPQLPWVYQTWLYMGQGTLDEPTDGSCGSVVVDEEGFALCFFRWKDMQGHAIGVSATELENYGFQIV